MKKWKAAILGAGNIARKMAVTMAGMEEVQTYAVASRSLERAQDFASEYGFEKAYGSYEEMLCDEQVELVYIATPHSEHFENAKLCILHGKPVLCEKAFTANAWQAKELIRLAEEKRVFITEAIWTRYLPMLETIRRQLDSGIIGKPSMLTANLGYVVDQVPRIQQPGLAGGALLDLGVYPLNFALMVFGNRIRKISSVCTYTDTGVDEQNSMTLLYEDGRVAQLNSSILSVSDRRGVIYGSQGFMVIENINNYENLSIYNNRYEKIRQIDRPAQITGYEYEVRASLQALEEGRLECPQMPHEEIIRVMEMMDTMRKEWGVVYPFDGE